MTVSNNIIHISKAQCQIKLAYFLKIISVILRFLFTLLCCYSSHSMIKFIHYTTVNDVQLIFVSYVDFPWKLPLFSICVYDLLSK